MIQTGNIKSYFKGLHFDEGPHTYSVHDIKMPSVSKLIGNFYNHFDSQTISEHVAKKEGVTQQEILEKWEDIRNEACDRGHRVHNFAESFVYDSTLKPSCNQEKAVVKFWNDLPSHIVCVVVELQMYHKQFLYAGTCDVLLYDKKEEAFILVDYKTNNDLYKNFNETKLSYPFSDLYDCPMNKYQIQLSLYQLLFEQTGFKVSKRRVVWLQKDATYKMYDCSDFTNTLRQYLLTRN